MVAPANEFTDDPIGTLCFSLPAHASEMHLALHAGRLLSAILEIDQDARSAIKYRDLDDECSQILEQVRAVCGEEIAFFEQCLG